ncbi:VOC family protein [Streptomyces sp. CMB-StM0423]|uniref:VOC family protein n=1 Tax=Streptomyces sp. CMB-StM0423 TaxID=2059884 RepID=UPI000C70D704|nr:VOC family protein [Streptomyces sp. CMB-StM0423]AUH41275.1 glyoxalase [Streptomyces sp. CMB-StM0423]
MLAAPVTVALPTADRREAHRFYREGLGLEAIGELAEDGVPEPLQFAVTDGLRIMLVPTGGFGWITGDHEVAPRGHSECVLSVSAGTEADVDALVGRARTAGAQIVAEPAKQPWGYTGTFADPDGHLWMITTGSWD